MAYNWCLRPQPMCNEGLSVLMQMASFTSLSNHLHCYPQMSVPRPSDVNAQLNLTWWAGSLCCTSYKYQDVVCRGNLTKFFWYSRRIWDNNVIMKTLFWNLPQSLIYRYSWFVQGWIILHSRMDWVPRMCNFLGKYPRYLTAVQVSWSTYLIWAASLLACGQQGP